MYRFDDSRSRKMALCDLNAELPDVFASVPTDVAMGGGFAIRGLSTGRILNHRSALSLAIGLDLEWNRQLIDMVVFDDLLADGGPSWAERMADRLDADHAPDLLVRMDLCGRIFEQAISLGRAAAATNGREDGDTVHRMRDEYRDRGIVWGLVTEASVCPTRASTLLWLSMSAQTTVPDAAKVAVRNEIIRANGECSLATIVLRAALQPGVGVPMSIAALGHLAADRELRINIDGGAILSRLPPMTSSRCYSRPVAADDDLAQPAAIPIDRPTGPNSTPLDGLDHAYVVAEAWRSAFAREHRIRSHA